MSELFGERYAHLYTDPQTRNELLQSERYLQLLGSYQSIMVGNEEMFTADFLIDFNRWRIMAEKKIVSEHLADDFYYVDTIHSWPASPWQFFKERHRESWWLSWLVRRRPVEYQQTVETGQIQVQRYLGYPDAHIPSSKLGRSIPIERVLD